MKLKPLIETTKNYICPICKYRDLSKEKIEDCIKAHSKVGSINTCQKCGEKEGTISACPYASEINDDETECCCCEECRQNCAWDI